ncbi:MAG: pantetheine-phosphate adenylyltransferase [Lachnospiraceae bacterium]|nr:pantetheine-phosphate adenylyltransferase [Lachnospiraceae bacterium]
MRIGVYPGSFDPVTLGHLDIIERGAKIVDKLIVGVLLNGMKNPMFSVEQRIQLLKEATKHLHNVEIRHLQGLLVDFLKQEGATEVIRGLRAVTDFEYELQMAQANRNLYPEMETVFLTTNVQYSFISSTIVKDILRHNGDVSHFVPQSVLEMIYNLGGSNYGSSNGN